MTQQTFETALRAAIQAELGGPEAQPTPEQKQGMVDSISFQLGALLGMFGAGQSPTALAGLINEQISPKLFEYALTAQSEITAGGKSTAGQR